MSPAKASHAEMHIQADEGLAALVHRRHAGLNVAIRELGRQPHVAHSLHMHIQSERDEFKLKQYNVCICMLLCDSDTDGELWMPGVKDPPSLLLTVKAPGARGQPAGGK